MLKLPKRNVITSRKPKALHLRYEKYIGLKPSGFCYSLYNGWFNWVSEEMPEWLYKYIGEVTLHKNVITNIYNKDPNKLLVISNWEDYYEFINMYKHVNKKVMKNIKKSGIISHKSALEVATHIDWPEVAKNFGGIEINLNPRMQKYTWFHTWDVPSGCIWNVREIVKETKVIYEKNKKTKKYVKVAK